MQSHHAAWRYACKAGNAYNPVLALRAAFGSSARCLEEEEDIIPSTWEATPYPIWKTTGGDPDRRGRRDVEQKSTIQQVDVRTSARQHEAGRPPLTARHDQPKDTLPFTGQGRNAKRIVPFTGHLSWKPHIAKVRGASLRVRQAKRGEMPHLLYMKRLLDYNALVIQPEPSSLITPLPTPWATKMPKYRLNPTSVDFCLSNDIERFATWITPTAAEQRARTAVVQETLKLIREALDPATTGAELFGSEKNGIALPFSDIDIRIYDIKDPGMPHFRLTPRLERIARSMRAGGRFMIPTVRSSVYPILNCHHRESGIDVQIVANNDSKPQQEVVTKYIQQVPQLREVYLVVRTILSMRGLVDVFSGGMGSYGTFVMVLAILKRHMMFENVTPESGKTVSSASQLFAFFEFYRKLDTSKHAVAVHPRTLFKKHESTAAHNLKAFSAAAAKRGDPVRAGQWELGEIRPFQPYLLCLQDPANPRNDLGSKTHAIRHIHATLAYLHECLAMACATLQNSKSSLSSHVEPLLLPLLGRCHEVYRDRRNRLEEYGRRLEADGIKEEDP